MKKTMASGRTTARQLAMQLKTTSWATTTHKQVLNQLNNPNNHPSKTNRKVVPLNKDKLADDQLNTNSFEFQYH